MFSILIFIVIQTEEKKANKMNEFVFLSQYFDLTEKQSILTVRQLLFSVDYFSNEYAFKEDLERFPSGIRPLPVILTHTAILLHESSKDLSSALIVFSAFGHRP